mgnify:CR=1 FL=1|jgi:hypothetical protein
MANAVYPKYKELLLGTQTASSLTAGTVKVALVDTGTYTYSAAHNFYDDISGVVGTPQTIGTVTVVNGLFDGDNVTFSAVSGATCEALVIYIDTAGAAGTDPLVAYIDTGVTGLPVTPNGGDITITWNASGIIQF